jgi:hypothetical protein
VDHPDFIYDERRDRGAFTFAANYGSSSALYAGYVDAAQQNLWFWPDTCSSALSHVVQIPRAAFDSNGDMHIVYQTSNAPQTIRTTIFHPDSHTFDCNVSTADALVGSWYDPTHADGSLSGCSKVYPPCYDTLNAIAGGCLHVEAEPTIAVDRNSSPNKLVVAYATDGSGGCKGYYEGRWYLSTNNGASWSYQTVTGCQDNIHNEVAWDYNAGYGGVAGRFHTLSTYTNNLSSNYLYQVDWVSTNGGQSWSGSTMTGNTINGPVNTANCYWGDYNMAAPDHAHGQYFYGWGAPGTSPYWYIEGITNGE